MGSDESKKTTPDVSDETATVKTPGKAVVRPPAVSDQCPLHAVSQMTYWDELLRRLEQSAEKIATSIRRDSKSESSFSQRVKDVGPIFTSSAAVLVTIIFSIATCKFNDRQVKLAEKQANVADLQMQTAQADLRRSLFAEFLQSEDMRRVAANKLAASGVDALQAVKEAFEISKPEDPINQGAEWTVLDIYEAQPANRPKLLSSLLQWFDDPNPALRLSVLWLYIEASNEFTTDEKNEFFSHLKNRLGSNASNCAKEDGLFIFHAATFVGRNSFPEAKQILLGIIENCASASANDRYDGARSQAVNAMAELIRGQRLSRNERQQIKARFEALEPNATGQLKINLRGAIELITRMDTP